MSEAVALLGLGLVAGAYGTMIGAGGGFLIVPALLQVFHFPVLAAVGTSLCTVLANALSGTASYARQKRIDYRTGLVFAAAVVPGALGGALVARWWRPAGFSAVFGVLLVALAVFIAVRPAAEADEGPRGVPHSPSRRRGLSRRELADATGRRFRYAVDIRLGVVVSLVAGLVSSLLGIGGGIIHVPVMIYWLGVPAHVAVATSHFILSISSAVGVCVFAFERAIDWHGVLYLASGAVVGAQLGARLASRVSGRWLTRFLAVALFLLGLRLLSATLWGSPLR